MALHLNKTLGAKYNLYIKKQKRNRYELGSDIVGKIMKDKTLSKPNGEISKDEAKARIQRLIDKYNRISAEGKLKRYNEAMTKNDFIEPLFEALGWDVRNTETDDEVTPEDKVSKGRVDYAFRIEGIPKFLLEAKAIKVDLDEPKWAEQAINYAWHKGAVWAILCDFEGVKVFNSEVKELNPLQSMFFSINCEEYIDRFDQLWLLSRESFEKGIIDREAEKWGKKLKKVPVDKQLLADFTRFRDILSKDILLMNKSKHLEGDELDEAVQRILNRLIFIRKCEDNNLESNKLQSTYRVWDDSRKGRLYNRVKGIFRYFEKQYDSELFEHCICDQIDISNQVAKEVILGLYSTKDKLIHYDFSAIDADVLGNIYEQYLGHILKKTPKRAKVEAKHVRRKEMGIYYTPTYVVDYIVRNTVGELLKNKKFDADKIRILDPACGSGSFLLKAFDYLNAYHGKKDKDFTHQAQLDLSGAGAVYSRKVKILNENIFGVDLDQRAVEIAQLNLLLKTLEKKHRLPMLKENIKCGNSLIDDEEVAGNKAFKWEEEFEEIMNNGGFDVVIGNPPYIKEFVNKKIFEELKRGSSKVAKYYEGKMDYLYFFIELGIDLLKKGGYLSFITTNYWLQAEGAKKLREKILEETNLISVFDFNEFTVFEGTGQHNLVFVLQKKKNPNNEVKVSIVKDKIVSKSEVIESLKGKDGEEKIGKFISQPQKKFLQNKDFKIAFVPDKIEKICEKVKSQQNYFLKKKDVATGIDVHQDTVINSHLAKLPNLKLGDGIFVITDEELNKLRLSQKEKEIVKPCYTTDNLGRYFANKDNKKWIIYTTTETIKKINDFPKIKEHLDKFKDIITSDFGPYGLHRARKERFFLKEKIISLRKTKRPAFSYVDFPSYVSLTFFIIKPEDINLKYLTAILNSKLIHFWLYFKGKKEGNQLQIDKAPILTIPIKKSSESHQKPFIELADKMLSLNKRLNQLKDKETSEKKRIEKEIRKTDDKINALVYDLYGITKKEQEIIGENLSV